MMRRAIAVIVMALTIMGGATTAYASDAKVARTIGANTKAEHVIGSMRSAHYTHSVATAYRVKAKSL